MSIYFTKSFKDNVLKVCQQANFESLIDSEETKRLTTEYRKSGNEEKKKSLHAIIWNAVFSQEKYDAYLLECKKEGVQPKQGTRKNQFLKPSGLLMLDFDDVEEPKKLHEKILQTMQERDMSLEEVLGLSHITPSGKGLRLVVKRERGLSIPDEMMMWSDIAGKLCDPACKDFARLSFVPMREDVLYYDPKLLFTPIEDFPEEPVVVTRMNKKKLCKRDDQHETQHTTPQPQPLDDHNDAMYRAMTAITEHKIGGPAVEGNRHNKVIQMAAHLAYPMQHNEATMKRFIPDYGLPADEYNDIIKYAAENNDIDFETRRMKETRETIEEIQQEATIENAMEEVSADVKALFNILDFGELPKMPSRLPEPMRLITDTLPDQTKAYGALAMFAPLGLYLKNVRFNHIRDGYKEPCFMVVAVGLSSTGKSDPNRLMEFILEPIQRTTDINEARLEEYNRQVRKLSKNAARPAEPKDLVMQIAPSNMTEAAKLKWLKLSAPYRLFVDLPELKLAYKMNSNIPREFWADVCRCFDGEKISAARASTDAVQGSAIFRMNWVARTTPSVFFTEITKYGSVADGALSRLTVAKLVTNDDYLNDISTIKDITDSDSDAAALRGYIQRLKDVDDQKLTCDEARQWHIRELKRYNAYEKASGFANFSSIYRRALTAGFNRAMILWIMNNQRWSQEIDDFATWSVEYDLWGKVSIFGETIKEQFAKDTMILAGKSQRSGTLTQLPSLFSLDDLIRVRESMGLNTGLSADQIVKKSKDQSQHWVVRNLVKYMNAEKTLYAKI